MILLVGHLFINCRKLAVFLGLLVAGSRFVDWQREDLLKTSKVILFKLILPRLFLLNLLLFKGHLLPQSRLLHHALFLLLVSCHDDPLLPLNREIQKLEGVLQQFLFDRVIKRGVCCK